MVAVFLRPSTKSQAIAGHRHGLMAAAVRAIATQGSRCGFPVV